MIQVVCGILIWNDKVLIGKRKMNGKSEAGKWEFPGGKVEDGESQWEAIKREFKEELDIEVHPFHHFRPVSNGTIELVGFVLKLESGKARLNEHDEVRFVDKAEFFKMELTDLSKEVGRILFDSYSIFLKKES
jgi:8-oxo-dGTP diphosphatase